MATNIPPHNLGEVIDATVALINNPEIDLNGLMEHLPDQIFQPAASSTARSKFVRLTKPVAALFTSVESYGSKQSKTVTVSLSTSFPIR